MITELTKANKALSESVSNSRTEVHQERDLRYKAKTKFNDMSIRLMSRNWFQKLFFNANPKPKKNNGW
jgi:hypothetical protein